jgi:putative SOS response-associated peptidase YedK
MCGRFTLKASPTELAASFELFREPEWGPRFNVAPSQPIGGIRNVDGQREWSLLRWGLIPSWAKDEKIGYRMINARGETVHEKPSFRAAFKRRRCLIPVDGFYEWKAVGEGRSKPKQPFHIRRTDQQVFAFAGLWECWTSPDGSEVESCTIVTTSANSLLAQIHDRMPVILDPDEYDVWLDTDVKAEALQQLLDPHSTDTLEMYPVGFEVNNARTERPGLHLPINTTGNVRQQATLNFDDD